MIAAGAGHVDVLKAMQQGPSMLNEAADGARRRVTAVHGYKEVLDYLISKVDLSAQDEVGRSLRPGSWRTRRVR